MPINLLACSCVEATPEFHFSCANSVFLGKITSVAKTIRSITDERKSEPSRIRGRFEIQEVFKGNPSRFYYIETENHPLACGVDLSVGATYVFYTNEIGHTSLCSGSVLVNADDKNTRELLNRLRSLSRSTPPNQVSKMCLN